MSQTRAKGKPSAVRDEQMEEYSMYRMEPVEEPDPKTGEYGDWSIELEIGSGQWRNLATITDLRHCKEITTPDGNLSLVGHSTLSLRLRELPTPENARQTADEIAVALLQVPGKAKPSDLVRFVFHVGLCAATANNPPAWQHLFRYVAA